MQNSSKKTLLSLSLIIPLILWLFIVGCSDRRRSKNQDTLTIGDKSCPLEGIADSDKDKLSNRLKNRWAFPKESDIDTSFNWENLYQDGGNPRRFDRTKAGRLRGFVAFVTPQNAESCNCNFKDKAFSDIHIHLSPSEEAKDEKWQHIIVEITPRLREIMKVKNEDWSYNNLKKLRGQEIEVEGWLFYDWEHGDKAYLYNGDEQKSWRVSAWEIHPITSLTIFE